MTAHLNSDRYLVRTECETQGEEIKNKDTEKLEEDYCETGIKEILRNQITRRKGKAKKKLFVE